MNFLGELPDKTMFASLIMATRGRPFAVWLGATAAFAVHVVIATTVGVLLLDILPHGAVELAVALTFLVLTANLTAPTTRPGARCPGCYAGWAAPGVSGGPRLSDVPYAQGA